MRKQAAMLGLVALAVFALSNIPVMAQDSQAWPAVIASLLPEIGVRKAGSFNKAGEMGLGSGVAEIPFSHPCIETTKYPAKVSLAITYYGGEMAALLQMQGDAADAQTIQNATEELNGMQKSAARKSPGKSGVKTVDLAGAKVVYIEYTTECPAEGAAGRVSKERPPVPNVKLVGVARTANVRMEINLEGQITSDLALGVVKEAVENLRKAKFPGA